MTSRRMLLTIIGLFLAITTALGQAGQNAGFKVVGIVPTKNHPPSAPASQPANSTNANVPFNGITYNGGEVMDDPHGTNVYYIFYGDWSSDAQTILTDFISNVGGSAYFNINNSYFDVNKDGERVPVPNKVTFLGSITDKYSYGNSLSDNDVGFIVDNAIVSGKLPLDYNGQYFVLTSADVIETSGFCVSYCAWHGYTQRPIDPFDNIILSFVGNPDQCRYECEAQDPASPNNDPGADSMVSSIAHELSESVTDPLGDGWINLASGTENGDLCAYTYGNAKVLPNGAYYNLKLGKRLYLSQQIWVNRRGGYCAMSWGGDQ